MKRKKNITILLIFILVFAFWFFYLKDERENRLTRQAEDIITKVENYRIKNKELPNSLTDIGIEIIDETNPPVYYEKKDSLNYIVWFPRNGEDIKTYYSDTKKWENYQQFK